MKYKDTLWEDIGDDIYDIYKCPKCGFEVYRSISNYNYCPHCGALMRDEPKEYEREVRE